MEPMQIFYKLTYSDYLYATFYGVFLRHRTALKIAIVAVGASAIHMLGVTLGQWELQSLFPLLGAAYFCWLLILCGNILLSARKYQKSKDCLLGVKSSMTFSENKLKVSIPSKGVHCTAVPKDLPMVLELGPMFMIYLTPQQTYLLPHRCLAEGQRATLHRFFRRVLPERFSSQFDENGKSLSRRRSLFRK